MPDPVQPTAAIYLRISQDRSESGLAVERQRQDCERLCQQRGWAIGPVITDNDTSASRSRRREGFEQLLELVERGETRHVVAWNLDRITRGRRDTVRLIETGQEHGILLALARGSDLDMATASGRLMADVLASIARNEIEVKSDRQKRANLQRAQAGLPHTARRSYGYNVDAMTINEPEALLLKEAASKFLSGWTWREITYWLNESGHRTTEGHLFTPVVVRKHLTSKRNAGIRLYEGVEYEGKWPAIIDRDTHLRILHEAKRRSGGGKYLPKTSKYLLTGLVLCGQCGTPLGGKAVRDRPGKEARPTYVCPDRGESTRRKGCGGVSRSSVPLEHLIREAVIYRLDTPDLATLIEQTRESSELSDLLNQQDGLKARINQLVDDYADGTLDKPQFTRAKRRAESAQERVEQAITGMNRTQTVNGLLSAGESVREAWMRQPNGWRRQLIELLVERITVHKGTTRPVYEADGVRFRFDPMLVDVKWRH